MAIGEITNPYEFFTNADGTPLEAGQIYIGVDGLDPQDNPQAAYFDLAGTIGATQPIRTLGGYPVNAGSATKIFTDGSFSVKVLDENNNLVYSDLSVTQIEDSVDAVIARVDDMPLSFDTVADFFAATLAEIKTAANATTGTVYVEISNGGHRYSVDLSQAGAGNVPISLVSGGVKSTVIDGPNGYDVKAFGAKGDNTTDDSVAVQAALDAFDAASGTQTYGSSGFNNRYSGAVYFPNGRYKVANLSVDGFSSVVIRGEGMIILTNVSGTEYDQTCFTGSDVIDVDIQNVTFTMFDAAFDCNSGNAGQTVWDFTNCIFEDVARGIDTQSYATSRSTILNLTRCNFRQFCKQGVISYTDKTNVTGCFINNGSADKVFYGNSLWTFMGCIFVPVGSQVDGRCWLYLTDDDGAGGTAVDSNRGAYFDNCRLGAEARGLTAVVADYDVFTSDRRLQVGIGFHNCNLGGSSNGPFESGNSEGGLVYLKKWPAFVKFTGCPIINLGSTAGGVGTGFEELVAKSDSLTSDPPLNFRIELDEVSANTVAATLTVVETYKLEGSLRGYINSPDPVGLKGLLPFGYLPVEDSGTGGVLKSSFQVNSKYITGDRRMPAAYMITFGAMGVDTGSGNANYSGCSVYIMTISGEFSASTMRSKVSVTKLHGGTYGLNNASDADIVSAHWGTGDTGSDTAAVSDLTDLTITWGDNVATGVAKVECLMGRFNRYATQPNT